MEKIQYQFKSKEKHDLNYLVKGRNEPCRLTEIVEVISKIKNVSKEEIINISFENAIKVFCNKLKK
mgnify:CR=1 FL=1